MSTPAAPSMHGEVAQVGDFRIESSSSSDHHTGHSLEDTAKAVLSGYEARAKGEEPPPIPAPVEAKVVETTVTDDDALPADGKAPGETPPKKGSLRWRHDELRSRVHAATREFHEVSGRLSATQAEIAAAEKRLADLKAEQGKLATPAAATPAPAPTADTDPQPEWDGENGYEAQGKGFTQFQKDHAAWLKRQITSEIKGELTAAQQKAADEAKAAADAAAATNHEVAATERVRTIVADLNKDPEVAQALQSDEFLDMPRPPFMSALIRVHPDGANVLRHLATNPADGYAFASLEMTQPMMEAFKATDDPVRLLHALANNIPEAQRIARLSDYQALKALAALETSSPGAKPGTPAETPRQPAATPLPAKLGGRSAAHVSSLVDLAQSTDNFEEYARRRLAGEDLPG